MDFFSINYILFSLADYPVSSVELIGTLSGFLCVIYCARGTVAAWPMGIINSVFFFLLFYQTRLYPDMFLQVYYFITSIYGWWRWKNPRTEAETDRCSELKITALSTRAFLILSAFTITASAAAGYFISEIHNMLPVIFPEPSSFPFSDSLVAVLSVTAQVLLSTKKRENWVLWIAADTVAAVIYFTKGIYLVGTEYVIFGIIASAGLWNWNRIFNDYETEAA